MFVHAITRCDTVSALYTVGKKKTLAIIYNGEEGWSVLNTFSQLDSTHAEVEHVGELFLLKLYGALWFQMESLPSTSAAAKYHS